MWFLWETLMHRPPLSVMSQEMLSQLASALLNFTVAGRVSLSPVVKQHVPLNSCHLPLSDGCALYLMWLVWCSPDLPSCCRYLHTVVAAVWFLISMWDLFSYLEMIHSIKNTQKNIVWCGCVYSEFDEPAGSVSVSPPISWAKSRSPVESWVSVSVAAAQINCQQ